MRNKIKSDRQYVCLGGGVGTVQLITGLKKYAGNITVIASMADDGGSGGRLRRLYSVPPPGDLINCLCALSGAPPKMRRLLTYRFPGKRFDNQPDSLSGQKLGNLMLVALCKQLGNFNSALRELEKIFRCSGRILPVTAENIEITAKTVEGKIVKGETNIDRGLYRGRRELSRVYLQPANAVANREVVRSVAKADCLILGPGDLYTTLIPVLLVKGVSQALIRSKAVKIYIANVANKPFETPDYKLNDFLTAIEKHAPGVNFHYVLANNNYQTKIRRYTPVKIGEAFVLPSNYGILVKSDFISRTNPLYHDPGKLASRIDKIVNLKK